MSTTNCQSCGATGTHHLCESIEAQAEEALSAVDTDAVTPHIAQCIEPGAILYSSWGYDQTNIDYYMVTRTTKASAWIVPMHHLETPRAGYSDMSGFTTPLEPMSTERVWDHEGNRIERPITPELHRIKRYDSTECLSLTSYSSAWLWDGRER